MPSLPLPLFATTNPVQNAFALVFDLFLLLVEEQEQENRGVCSNEPAACRCENMLYVGADTVGVAVVRGGKFNSIVNSNSSTEHRIANTKHRASNSSQSPNTQASSSCGHRARRQFRGLSLDALRA